MFSSNSVKIFFVLVVLCVSSCSFWRGKTAADPAPTPFVARELKSEIPFATKEPEIYQTEIVISDGKGFEENTFAAKNGVNSLMIYGFQGKNEIALLKLGENQTFLFDRVRKIIVENAPTMAASREESLPDLVSADLLNRQGVANFENLGAENGLVKYRVASGDAANSEVIIYFDEKINLPVKQEFYSGSGEQKSLTSAVELRNFSAQVNAELFEVPKDYRRVSLKEFHDLRKRAEK